MFYHLVNTQNMQDLDTDAICEQIKRLTKSQQRMVLRDVLLHKAPHPTAAWMDRLARKTDKISQWPAVVESFFWISTIISIVSHVPQIARPLILRDAYELSTAFLVLVVAAHLLRIVYSCMIGAISNLAGLSITLAMYVVILGIKVWFSYTHCDPDNKAAEVNMQRFSPGVQRFLFGRAVPASRP